MRRASGAVLCRAVVVAACTLAVSAASAQETDVADACRSALAAARGDYQIGRLVRARAALSACAGHTLPLGDRTQALLLEIRIALALDQDDEARAAADRLFALQPTFRASRGESERLLRLLDAAHRRHHAQRVHSPSARPELLDEAPGTIHVITAEEIEGRGYLELSDVLADIPGIDLSRGRGDAYASVYLRGLRTDGFDPFLLLVDGVEANDLQSSLTHLAREYSLQEISRVEVLFGPAAAVYGPGAATGVIQIITKEVDEQIRRDGRWAGSATAVAGSRTSVLFDGTFAGQSSNERLRWSLTARAFRADDASFAPGTADPEDLLRDIDYAAAVNTRGSELAFWSDPSTDPEVRNAIRGLYLDAQERGFVFLDLTDEGETLTGIRLTPEGVSRARELDRAVLEAARRAAAATRDSQDLYVHGRLQLGDLRLGVHHRRRTTSVLPWFTRLSHHSGRVEPAQTSLYARLSRRLGTSGRTTFDLLTTFRQSSLATDDDVVRAETFASGGIGIHAFVWNLGEPPLLPRSPLEFGGRDPFWQREARRSTSRRYRADAQVTHAWSPTLLTTGGLELRDETVQGGDQLSSGPESTGIGRRLDTLARTVLRPGRLARRNLAASVAVAWKPSPGWRFDLGVRLDRRSTRANQSLVLPEPQFQAFLSSNLTSLLDPAEFALATPIVESSRTTSSPRASLTYPLGSGALRGSYASGSIRPTDRQLYGRELGYRALHNPDLEAARVRQWELGYRRTSDSLSLDVGVFRADYRDLPRLVRTISAGPLLGIGTRMFDTGQYVPGPAIRVYGTQVSASGRRGDSRWFANYTYLDPTAEAADGSRLRGADIAAHRLNVGVTHRASGRLDLHLRANLIGSRPAGAATTLPSNPTTGLAGQMLAHAAVTYRDVFPGLSLQLTVNNLLDASVRDPGVLFADGGVFAPSIPQPGRSLFLRLRADVGDRPGSR